MSLVRFNPSVRDLTVPRRRRQRERQKSNRLNRPRNNNSARVRRFFVHFFAVTAGLRRENALFQVLWRT